MLERLKNYFSRSADRAEEKQERRNISMLDDYDELFDSRAASERTIEVAMWRLPIIVGMSGVNMMTFPLAAAAYQFYATEIAPKTLPVINAETALAICLAPVPLGLVALWENKSKEKMHTAFVEIDRQREWFKHRHPKEGETDWNALREKRDALRAMTPES